MASPLYKIPPLLAAAYTTGVALTAPVPPPNKKEVKHDVSTREKVFRPLVRLITTTLKVIIWSGALCETAVIFAREYLSHPLAQEVVKYLVPGPTSSVGRIAMSPAFLAGCGVAMATGYLRILCFRELGKLFTYELTIRDGHRLVTSGPYAVVRHPSYTMLIVGIYSIAITHAARGSWFRECGVAGTTLGKSIALAFLFFMVHGTFNLVARAPNEDEILRKEFGKEWEDYARRVPYRLIPGIY